MKQLQNMIYRPALLLLFMFGIGMGAHSQDFEKDLLKVHRNYLAIQQLDARVDVQVYANESAKTPLIRKQALLKKAGENYIYSFDNTTMLWNSKCVITVNSTDRDIVYSAQEKRKKGKSAQPDMVTPDVDELMKKYDRMVYNGLHNGSKHYIVFRDKDMIRKTELFIDPDRMLLTKLIYHYNEQYYGGNSKVEVIYTSMNLSPGFSSSEFSEKRFVVRSGNKWTASKKYEGYAVHINNYRDQME